MSRAHLTSPHSTQKDHWVGVGLRHPHYREALRGTAIIDFVEIHAENFFADGGLTKNLLEEISETYAISLHATSMGLGSAAGIQSKPIEKMKKLVDRINPFLVSDHASFSWSSLQGNTVHAGDLLPLEFNQQSLKVLIDNVDRVQQLLGRQILVENVSAYIQSKHSNMSETEFLSELAKQSGCGLLIDLNNTLVNLHNEGDANPLSSARQWVANIPAKYIAEVHLAGYSKTDTNELIIDDHAQAVSDECWELYRYTIQRCGALPTLIEWDNNLPSWNILLSQAAIARSILEEQAAIPRSKAV